MRTPVKIMKQEFIEKWIVALRTCCKVSRKERTKMEKKNVIKETAAVAMAATKGGSTAWSRAIIAEEYEHMNNKILVEALMGSQNPAKSSHTFCKQKVMNRMVRRRRRRSKEVVKASSLAKSIIKKQTQVLRRLIPGGETLDECCLIEEALDYIVSLKAQVDVMKELVIAAEVINKP